jgi:hypothetical protein
MIKRIQLVSRRAELSVRDFPAAWVDALALGCMAPASVRPARTVACMTLPNVAGSDTRHDAISMEWFADMQALRRFEAWLSSADGQRIASTAGVVELDTTVVIIAEEVVMRGAEWLQRRWLEGGVKVKHMALARRAQGLSPAEFSERWRNRSGNIGGAGSAASMAIPDETKGHAYVQNHPVANAESPWTYDAVNEVYFDDLDAMRSRNDFFRKHDVARADADLVSAATFVAVREQVIDTG